MTQNLRLIGSKTLTSSDSDVSANFTLPASTGGIWGTGSSWDDVSSITDAQINTLHAYNTNNSGYGVYHNWYTATAGTGTASVTSGNTASTICPKGWTLPIISGSKSWYNLLVTKYSFNESNNTLNSKALAQPFSLIYSGYFLWNEGNVINQGTFGMYWTKVAIDRTTARFFQFTNEWGLRTRATGHPKAFGFSIRCVSK